MPEKKSVLTLNLGSQRVSMARFGIGARGNLLLRSYAVQEMVGDPTAEGTRQQSLTQAVRELTAQFKAAQSEVNYAVPGQFLIAKFVKLPPLAEDQVEKIVGFEAQQAVPFPLNETVWDYQLMGKSGGEVEVGIVAIRTEHLTDLNSAVEDSGLVPRVVDAAPVALYNAFRYSYPDAEGCSLLIDLGARTTNLIFIEGHRAFITSFQTGGASITQSIAREMEMDFDTAEGRKVNEGFVNLGGNYADHEDPEIDAMSKIIRNALNKVHGEITRRTSAYRSQQGGSAPSNIYLAGAGASMPYLKEVFEEKLRAPVHYFNPLLNVAVGPRVNVEQVSAEAHTLGELVGLALRELSCPMELDLAPPSVKAVRDVGSRKPNLILAAASLFAGLLGLGFYNTATAEAYNDQTQSLAVEVENLERFDRQIKEQEARQKQEEGRVRHLQDAVALRSYWVHLLNALNAQLEGHQIWLTQISPITDTEEEAIPGLLSDALKPDGFGTGAARGGNQSQQGTRVGKVVALHVAGINRGDAQDVFSLFHRLKDNMKDFFAFPELEDSRLVEDYVLNNIGARSSQIGYVFQFKLPLKRTFEMNLIRPTSTSRR